MTFTPVVLGTGLAAYAFLRETKASQQASLEATPQNQRDAEALRSGLNSLQTAEDLMNDRRMLSIALGAFGLEEDINNRAFLEQVLESDLSDPGSLANRLTDKRYLALTEAFGFNSPQGPQLPGSAEADALVARLNDVGDAQDLLNDPALLRATLNRFDLPESDANNRYFLEQVMNSDPADSASFANQLSRPGYAELAQTLNFAARGSDDPLKSFVELAASAEPPVRNSDDFLAQSELVTAALELYGLESPRPDDSFLKNVLDSDLNDPASFANTRNEDIWASFSKAFGFGERLARPGSFLAENTAFDAVVEGLRDRDTPYSSELEFLGDIRTSLAVAQFFDLPREGSLERNRLILASDRDQPDSFVNVIGDDRYRLYHDAVKIETPETGWSPPAGFADSLMDAYLERQFEIRVGEVNSDMRLALGFERDLNNVLDNARSNDARWFGVLASEPLRRVMEAALGLPDQIGALDLDQQLSEFKSRAQSRYGSDQLADLATPDNAQDLLQSFLSSATIGANQGTGISSGASTILSSVQQSLAQR